MSKPAFPALQQTRTLLFWVALSVAIVLLSRLLNPVPDVNQLSVAQARSLIDDGAMVIDVRGPEAYGHRHIPGAINLPLAVLQAGLPAVLHQALSEARDRPIVVYCNDGVRTGPDATLILNRAGFAHASNVHTGIEGWVAAGHAVAR